MPATNPDILDTTARQLRDLGKRIRARRKALNISATVAAEAAGMSRITWHRIEKGEPSVTIGAWANALNVIGLTLAVPGPDDNQPDRHDWIPARIRLADYPQLQKLAWHVRGEELNAREALDIYERNLRHIDMADMTETERQLLDALRKAFGEDGDRHG